MLNIPAAALNRFLHKKRAAGRTFRMPLLGLQPISHPALTRFDFEDSTSQQRAGDLEIVLREARQRDALTLWHLLARVDERQRVLVYDRLSKLAPPPASVTKGNLATRSDDARPVVERAGIRRHLGLAPLGALLGRKRDCSRRVILKYPASQ